MKLRFSTISLMIFLLSGCNSIYSSRVDNRNFALDTYQLQAPQIQAAETRAQSFWRKNAWFRVYGPLFPVYDPARSQN